MGTEGGLFPRRAYAEAFFRRHQALSRRLLGGGDVRRSLASGLRQPVFALCSVATMANAEVRKLLTERPCRPILILMRFASIL